MKERSRPNKRAVEAKKERKKRDEFVATESLGLNWERREDAGLI
jgi:hypothetical protein